MNAEKNILKISTEEILFYLFFSSLLFAKGIGLYDGQTEFKVFLVIGLIGWLLKMCITDYSFKEIILIGVLVLIGGVVYKNSGDKGALLYILMITGLKNVPVKRIFAVGLFTWIVSFGSLYVLTATHLLDSPFRVHEKLGLGLILRWALGYAHPNVLHVSYLVLVYLAVYLLGERVNWKWLLFFMAGNIYVFIYSVSSTGFLSVCIYLGLSAYWMWKKHLSKFEQIILQLCLPFCALFSLLAPLVKNEFWFNFLDSIVNTRLRLARYFLQNQPVTLLGADISDLQSQSRTIDNSYVYAYVIYGVIIFSLFMAAYFILIHSFAKKQKGAELCMILTTLISGLLEPYLFNTSFKNISLLFMGAVLFKETAGEGGFCVIHKGKREVEIPLGKLIKILEKIRGTWCSHWKGIILVSALAGTFASVGYGLLAAQPDRYIVPHYLCDKNELEILYLNSEDDIPREGDKIIGYIDPVTQMVAVEGNVLMVEKFRGIVTSGIFTFVFCGFAILGAFYITGKNGTNNNYINNKK